MAVKDDDYDGTSGWHWFATQLINLPIMLLLLFIPWATVSTDGRNALNLTVWLLPLYIPLTIAQYFICWRPSTDCRCCMVLFSLVNLMMLGIYYGVFYGTFYKTLKYDFLPVTKC
jgi:hypothetical protein